MPIRSEALTVLLQNQDQQFVEQAYQILLGRTADTVGLRYYLQRLREGVSKMQILFELYSSPECRKTEVELPGLREKFILEGVGSANEYSPGVGVTSSEQAICKDHLLDQDARDFVESAYLTLLGRPADSVGLSAYMARLRAGDSKTQILREIFASPEYKATGEKQPSPSKTHVRDDIVGEFTIGFTQENKMVTPAETLASLLGYNGRYFVECAYVTLLKRVPDRDGFHYYLSKLRNGAAKVEIIREIATSDEGRKAGVVLTGLQNAIWRHTFAQLPFVGKLFKLFVVVEGHSPEAQGKRALQQESIDSLYELCARLDRAEQSKLERFSTLETEVSALGALVNTNYARYKELIEGLQQSSLSGAHVNARFDRIEQSMGSLLKSCQTTAPADVRFDSLEQRLVELQQTCLFIEQTSSHYVQKKNDATNIARDNSASLTPTFFTICSKNFTAYAKTLFDSVTTHHPQAEMYMFLCDGIDAGYDPSLLPFKTVTLAELDIPDVQGMAERYNITEFNTSIKPYAFSYLFSKLGKDQVIYLDPDIILTSPLTEAIEELSRGAECLLTPHILGPAENVEVSDNKMLLFGIYNLGFLGLRNTPCVTRVVEWWSRRLERDCVIDLANGLFVDQKWADLLPAFIGRTSVLHHPGYNVAYWNLSQRTVELVNGNWYSNRQPLRFVHFSGNNLDDPHIFSRHSGTLNRENIGDLKYLLDTYRQAVYANGHEEYRKYPYTFSWNGASGLNLHTPKPPHQPDETIAQSNARRKFVARPIPKVFVTDWSTPRPDQDAGSVTTFFLLKIMVELGYDVTFVPSDLTMEGEYTSAVRNVGVRCLHREDIGTIQKHLQQYGSEYSIVVLFRAPIAALHLDDVMQYASNAKVILETVDLHYLRSERAAATVGTEQAIIVAKEAKDWELSIIRRCDVSIVLSSFENDLLSKELPTADIRTLPLLFLDMPGKSHNSFEQRKDILFIGGFRHEPNIDAVIWFCHNIWPRVNALLPDVEFLIVGSHPTAEVLALSRIAGVKVLGYVKDIESTFGIVRLSVAPLRYGAGIKGKVATSLGYGVPVVGTHIAFEGMELVDGTHAMFVDDNDVEAFVETLASTYRDADLWHRLSSQGFNRINSLYSESAGRARVRGLLDSLKMKSADFEFHRFRWQEEYLAHKNKLADEYRRREEIELGLISHDTECFYIEGYCAVCCESSKFQVSFMYSYLSTADGKPIPNWREHLNCVKCGHQTRIRLITHLLRDVIRPKGDARMYITEQTTSFFKLLQSQYSQLSGSEFLGDSVPRGAYRDGLRNEDMTRLSFPSDSFDLILSCDVLEHVTDDLAALRECFRCLAPGGTFIFAAPCNLNSRDNIVRARRMPDGTTKHLITPPEYHGNPVDPENGALCYRYFGWEVIQQLRTAGFEDAYVISAWSRNLAYLGGEQIVFVATKGNA